MSFLFIYETLIIPICANFLDRILFHPVDNVLSYQQSRGGGILSAIKDIITEKGYSGFYSGFLYLFFTIGPVRIIVCSFYYNVSAYLINQGIYPNFLVLIYCSLLTGIIDATLICPAELIRVRKVFKLEIPKKWNDFYIGYLPILTRCIFGCLFTFFGSDILLSYGIISDSAYAPFIAGFIMGIIAQIFTTPADVWKNKVMTDIFFRNSFYHLKVIFLEKYLYRGVVTRIIRMSGGSSVMVGTVYTLKTLPTYWNVFTLYDAYPTYPYNYLVEPAYHLLHL